MPECATTDCPVPQECDGTACLPGAPAGCQTRRSCDEWPDGKCHAHCYTDGETCYQPDGAACESCTADLHDEEQSFHAQRMLRRMERRA